MFGLRRLESSVKAPSAWKVGWDSIGKGVQARQRQMNLCGLECCSPGDHKDATKCHGLMGLQDQCQKGVNIHLLPWQPDILFWFGFCFSLEYRVHLLLLHSFSALCSFGRKKEKKDYHSTPLYFSLLLLLNDCNQNSCHTPVLSLFLTLTSHKLSFSRSVLSPRNVKFWHSVLVNSDCRG